MRWPVCGVQYELFPGSTRLLSLLVRQTTPETEGKHTSSQLYLCTLRSSNGCFYVCCRVVYSVLFDSWEIIGPYRAWWLLNGLLLLLQVLHIIWFYLIARIAIKAIFKGKVSPPPSKPTKWFTKNILPRRAGLLLL